ncbi:hypothetical protein GCM10022416_56170 [Actinomadura keratinilytica]|uniref:Uncharacterized protein n=1 Tax=Actinomadura keratinilytica TaxID=547461 RepID=A0ABP7ZF04_9ACTN
MLKDRAARKPEKERLPGREERHEHRRTARPGRDHLTGRRIHGWRNGRPTSACTAATPATIQVTV